MCSTAAFFLLRHYVTERIKADFAKELEAVRQRNQTEIEVLRGTTQRDLEALKSSLEISRSAARILIERRIQSYEEYFRSLYAVENALAELSGAFQMGEGEVYQGLRQTALERFFAAFDDFHAWMARSIAFIPKGLHPKVSELGSSLHRRSQAISKRDFKNGEKEEEVAIGLQVEADHIIRTDLAAIQKTGSLPPD